MSHFPPSTKFRGAYCPVLTPLHATTLFFVCTATGRAPGFALANVPAAPAGAAQPVASAATTQPSNTGAVISTASVNVRRSNRISASAKDKLAKTTAVPPSSSATPAEAELNAPDVHPPAPTLTAPLAANNAILPSAQAEGAGQVAPAVLSTAVAPVQGLDPSRAGAVTRRAQRERVARGATACKATGLDQSDDVDAGPEPQSAGRAPFSKGAIGTGGISTKTGKKPSTGERLLLQTST